MRYKKFGSTGLFVSELCLGTMTFGGEGELWSKIGALQQEDANRLVGRALEAGVNFIDTADVYSEGRSEVITGQALRDLKVARDDVVVATKVFGQTGAGVNAVTRGEQVQIPSESVLHFNLKSPLQVTVTVSVQPGVAPLGGN